MAEWTEVERMATLRALRSRSGDIRSDAIEKLCVKYEPLVKAQARVHRFLAGTTLDIEDLEQEARVGLIEACASFVEIAKRKKWNDGAFSTYAMWCIRNAVSKYFESIASPIRLPAWMIRRLPKLRKTNARLAQQLGREPTINEIAADMKLPIHAIETLLAYEIGPYELPDSITGTDQFFSRDTTYQQDLMQQNSYIGRHKEKYRHG